VSSYVVPNSPVIDPDQYRDAGRSFDIIQWSKKRFEDGLAEALRLVLEEEAFPWP